MKQPCKLALLAILALPSGCDSRAPAALVPLYPPLATNPTASIPLPPSDLSAIANTACSALGFSCPTGGSPWLESYSFPVYVALRHRGGRVAHAWGIGKSWSDNLAEAARQCSHSYSGEIDAVDVCLTHSYQKLGALAALEPFRGLEGLALESDHLRTLCSPNEMVAADIDFSAVLAKFRDDLGQLPGRLAHPVRGQVFEGYQVEVFPPHDSAAPTAFTLERGHAVETGPVNESDAREMAEGMESYLLHSVDERGAFPYLYNPVTDTATHRGLLMVRPLLALLALGEQGQEARDGYRRALAYYRESYYHVVDGRGLAYVKPGEVTLGACAVMGLAVLEGPLRRENADVVEACERTVDSLTEADGHMRSYLEGPDRGFSQDYYPGEALLFKARLYERHPTAERLLALMRSFRFYREWFSHPKNRRPAFIPWQSEAYAVVWRRTHDRELQRFLLESNDWLLKVQQWDEAPAPDARGQFFDPEHPTYNRRPHVSADGVYVSSLAEAFELARAVGDKARAERYRLAICRGLRNIRLHQFRTRGDTYLARNPARALGGLRSSLYDVQVRIDSVGENLMGLRHVLRLFRPEDFRE